MTGIHTAYTGERKIKLVQGRLRALLLIFIIVTAVFLCVSITFFSKTFINWLTEDFSLLNYSLLNLLRIAAAIIFIYLLVICIYLFTPNIKGRIKTVSVGAILTSIGWIVATWGFEIYMNQFNNYSALYGSIGAFLGLTLWLYIVSIVLLCGAEINVMLSARKGNLKKFFQEIS